MKSFFEPTAANTLGKLASRWKMSVYINYGSDDMSALVVEERKKFRSLLGIPTDKSLISLPYLVFEASCHTFHELAGDENHNLFDKTVVAKYANKAINKAYKDLGLTTPSNFDDKLVAGIAVWNLVLPESAGGVYPDSEYPEFAKNMHKNLTKFWTGYGCEKQITVEIMQEAYQKLREFAIYKLNLATQPASSNSSLTSPFMS
ncbi:hypothetical protein [Legionella gresilensis]|uniref:hypothetical protein n=1 Tax=Legionella gresilensis TaxID=91823 RepID=UPI00104118F7|nr:hypothetical protein [Legionella gresilensis]